MYFVNEILLEYTVALIGRRYISISIKGTQNIINDTNALTFLDSILEGVRVCVKITPSHIVLYTSSVHHDIMYYFDIFKEG